MDKGEYVEYVVYDVRVDAHPWVWVTWHLNPRIQVRGLNIKKTRGYEYR